MRCWVFFNNFWCIVNRKLCIGDIIIGNVLRLVWFRELRRACDCMGAKVRVSQRLKSLRGILVRNYGFLESDFFVVCEDIWIAICPFYVVVYVASFFIYVLSVQLLIFCGLLRRDKFSLPQKVAKNKWLCGLLSAKTLVQHFQWSTFLFVKTFI